MDVRKVRVLREVERRGTVSAAATALHLTPSAISQQIAVLARELGVPLLEKRGRGVVLTGQARVVLRHAASIDEQLERARADLLAWSDGSIGEIRIGSLSTGIARLVAPAIARLRVQRPGLSLRVYEREPEEAMQALDCGEIDLVMQAQSKGMPTLTDRRYHRVELLTDLLDVVLPADHPAVDVNGVRLADLANDVWVGGDPTEGCSSIALGACAAAGFIPDVQCHSRDWDAVAALVAAGVGVALIPRMAYPLRRPGLVCCPVVGSPAARRLLALVRAGAEREPGITAVIETLVSVAGEVSAGGAVRPGGVVDQAGLSIGRG